MKAEFKRGYYKWIDSKGVKHKVAERDFREEMVTKDGLVQETKDTTETDSDVDWSDFSSSDIGSSSTDGDMG